MSSKAELPFSDATERRLVALMLARLVLSLLSFGFLLLLDSMGIGPALSEIARLGLYWTLAVAFLTTALSGIFSVGFETRGASPHCKYAPTSQS